METLKDLISSIRSQFSERASNPLTASFIIAWPFSNFRVLTALLGEGDWKVKIEYIDKNLYPDWTLAAVNGFAIPLGFALFYVFIYPPIANKIIILHKRRQINQRVALLELENITPLTLDEANELRARHAKERIKWAEEKKQLQNEVEELTTAIQQQSSNSGPTPAQPSIDTPTPPSKLKKNQNNESGSHYIDESNGLWRFKDSSLRKFSPNIRAPIVENGIPYSAARLLSFLKSEGRPLSSNQIAERIHWSKLMVQENLDTLEWLKLIKSQAVNDRYTFLPSDFGAHIIDLLGEGANRWKN